MRNFEVIEQEARERGQWLSQQITGIKKLCTDENRGYTADEATKLTHFIKEELELASAIQEAVGKRKLWDNPSVPAGKETAVVKMSAEENWDGFGKALRLSDARNPINLSVGRSTGDAGGNWSTDEVLTDILKARSLDAVFPQLATWKNTYAVGELVQLTGKVTGERVYASDNVSITNKAAVEAGKISLTPFRYTIEIPVSDALLNNPAVNVRGFLIDELQRISRLSGDKHYIQGNGNSKPLGILNHADIGAETLATAATVTADKVQAVMEGLATPYTPRAVWMMPKETIQKIRMLRVDTGGAGTGDFFFQTDWLSKQGTPYAINGYPIYETDQWYDPDTAGMAMGIFGDFADYWIAELQSVMVWIVTGQTDVGLARSGESTIFVRGYDDGGCRDINAFRRLNRN